MTFLVPFDGSALSEGALARSSEYATVHDERIVAVSVVPADAGYAEEKGWIAEGEAVDPERIAGELYAQVTAIAPEADFRWIRTERFTPPGKIVREIRSVAREVDATVVFIGSDNAGRLVNSLSSIASGVTSTGGPGEHYDVHIVRSPYDE